MVLDVVSNLAQRVTPRPNATGPGPAALGLPAAKHFDPVVGIDIHYEIVPPVTPIPNPFVGFLFDPFDYIPFIGATVWVNGLPRAQAGTAGLCMPPHEPMQGPFVKPPGNECEMLMGSMTVAVDGDAFSYFALPALSCNDIGVGAPPRAKSPPVRSMVLPTSLVIAIPMGPPVFVGGPPTISLMALGMRFAMFGLGKALGALQRTGLAKKLRTKASTAGAAAKAKVTGTPRRRSPSTNKGCGRPGEPIDAVSGANVDEFHDFERPGAPPLVWTRYYDSRLAGEPSLIGRGFRLDLQRELHRTLRGFTYVDGEGEPVDLPPLRHHDDTVSHDGLRLRKLHGGVDGTLDGELYELETPHEVMRFAPQIGERPSPMVELRTGETTWHLEHDEHGRPIRIEDATRRLSLRYDPQGLLCEVNDGSEPEGLVLASYRYDARARLVEHRDAHGHAATYGYDDADRMTRKTDRNGYAFHYRYDEAGRCVHSWGDDGMYEICLAYDRPGRETTVRWPDGGVWRYRHDEHGVITEIVDPDGWSQRFVTDEHGVVRRHLDAAGNATELLYDDRGAHTHRRDPLGYLAPPIHVEPSPPDPLAYRLPDSPLGWRLGALQPRVQPAPATPPERAYDRQGQRYREQSDHGAERWQHDANGNVVGHRDRDGRITRLRLGSWNQLRERIDAEGGVTRFDSDFRESLTRIEDPGGALHEYAYDRKGRLVEVRRDGAPMERYRWGRADELVEKLDAHGRTLLTLTTGPGKLVKERRLATGEVQRFEHDARGRIVRASAEAGSETMTVEQDHDARARVTRDLRDGQGVEHELRGGQLVATRWLDRFEARYEPDGDDAVVIVDPTGGRHRLELGRDGTITRRLASGTVEHQRFDDRGLCLRSEVRDLDGAHRPWVREHRYSGHGDLLQTFDSERGVVAYGYDGLHRLVEARHGDGTRERYRWDPASNLLEQPGLRGVEVGPGNRLRTANGERLAHDQRLRLCRREAPAGAIEYHYDALDRLVAIDRHGERWSASYDPLGRRTRKTWRGRTTTYGWDDFRLATERYPDGTLRIYVYPDLEALVPLMFVEYPSPDADPSIGRVYHVFTDQVGAPLCVQDERGQVVWRARMRPFGAVEVEPGNTVALDLRFPGHLHDPETGLHYNRFRYYDPRLGRYLQSDPLGVAGGLNVYQYCPNPLSAVDLDGLMMNNTHATGHGQGAPNPAGVDAQPTWWSCIVAPFQCWSPGFHHHVDVELPPPPPQPLGARHCVGQGATVVAHPGDWVINRSTTACGLVLAHGQHGVGIYHWPFMTNCDSYLRTMDEVVGQVGPLSSIQVITNDTTRNGPEYLASYTGTVRAIADRYHVPTQYHVIVSDRDVDPTVMLTEDGFQCINPTNEIDWSGAPP